MASQLIRACYPAGGAEVTVKSDGTTRVSGFPTDIHEKIVALYHVANATHVTSALTVKECYERMKANETDFIVTRRPPTDDEDAIYYIAIQTEPFVNQIVSGYDYSQYIKSIESVEVPANSILKNFTRFEPSCIFLGLLAYFLLHIILRLVSMCGLDRRYSRTLASTWRKRESFCYEPVITSELVQFVLKAGFFLLSLPFLAEFSTNQVVTKPPDVITTYQEVMDRGVKIIFNHEVSDESLLKPSRESIAQNDISAQLYRYMMNNLYRLPLTSSVDTAAHMEPAVAALITGKIVMFAANNAADGFRDTFCAWSNESHLIHSLISTDPLSREIFTGYPMRKSFYSDALVKKLRRLFEAHLQRAVIERTPLYLGFDIKQDLTTPGHRLQQRILCMTNNLIRDQKEPPTTGIHTFSLVLGLHLTVNLIILVIHLVFKI